MTDTFFRRPEKKANTFMSSGDSGKLKTTRAPQSGHPYDQGDSNRMQVPRGSPPGAMYQHKKELAKLEEMNKHLNEIKDKLTKTSVNCHMLQVDLVTLYNPHSVQTLKNAKDACNTCSQTVENLNGQFNLET